jgi:Flp pilus assembly protein TadB
MEPEIIPPDQRDKRSAKAGTKIRISLSTHSGNRQLTGTGALLAIFLILALTILFVVIFTAVLGAVLVWVLVAALLVAIPLLLGIVRRMFGTFRN